MNAKEMRLKARINNYAKKNHIAAQVVLQNYMFERFLARLAASSYSEKFIIKGGMLISSIVGLDTRSTMDLDATLKNLSLTEDNVMEAVRVISGVDVGDGILFETLSIAPIRKDDVYGGFRVRLNATYETIVTPLSIDISTGDVITPAPVPYEIQGMFDETVSIRLLGYNIETILAEKAEAVLSRGVFSTRPRDYYDIYILGKTQPYDANVFREALDATALHRGTAKKIADRKGIFTLISGSDDLRDMWEKYRKKFPYAQDVSYEDVLGSFRRLLDV